MMQVIEFIAAHYIWFLVLAAAILLAVIGYYADKTNFGQGMDSGNENQEKEKINLDNVGLSDIANNIYHKNDYVSPTEESSNDVEYDLTHMVPNGDFTESNTNFEEKALFSEATINKFEDEFNSIMPQKDLVDSDLLNDIENFDLEKTQRIELNDVPDLDDVELPTIKKHVVEKDIWKF